MSKIIKIAITGPESTGKSTLCEQLANHFNTVWAEEFARGYLLEKEGKYSEDDILYIAQKQLELELTKEKQANKILFCDTEFINLKIWSEYEFGRCNDFIENLVRHHHYDLFLLTNNDVPWEPDLLRKCGNIRDYLFTLFENKLKEYKKPYMIISKTGNERFQMALKIVEDFISRQQ